MEFHLSRQPKTRLPSEAAKRETLFSKDDRMRIRFPRLLAAPKRRVNFKRWQGRMIAGMSRLRVESLEDRRLLATTVLDQVAPTAVLAANDITTPGGTIYEFTVTYSDNLWVDLATLDSDDIRVTGPNWPTVASDFQFATLVAVESGEGNAPRTATYRIAARGGGWDASDNGVFTVRMEPNEVTDLHGNAVASGVLGSFQVSVPSSGQPVANFVSPTPITVSGGTGIALTVLYTDDTAIQAATLDTTDIRVTGPNGFNQVATSVTIDVASDGTPRTATYLVAAPGGTWDAADDGTYAVSLQASQVADVNGNFVSAGTLGSFAVSIDSTVSLGEDVGIFDPITSTFSLRNEAGTGETVFRFGSGGVGWLPVIGDWNGDGSDDVGVFRPLDSLGQFILDSNGNRVLDVEDEVSLYGFASDTPVVGDWNGDGSDDIGNFRGFGPFGQFILDSDDDSVWSPEDEVSLYGFASDTPVVGDWDGDGSDDIGNFRGFGPFGQFILDSNDSGVWNPADQTILYGTAGDTPVVGNWESSFALMAAQGESPFSTGVAALQSSNLEGVVAEALASWDGLGLDPQTARSLASLRYVITDLPGATLGLAEHSTIYLDENAAGYGWFVDPTPALNEEFERSETGATLRAVDSVVAGRMDLLTVVRHELGHVLGLDDDSDTSAEGLMSGTLNPGVRHQPGPAEIDAVLAMYGEI